jgi:uncharacterized delta-60 repeat protein
MKNVFLIFVIAIFATFNSYAQDGALDPTFNPGGSGFDWCCVKVTNILSNGKILVGGYMGDYNGNGGSFMLARINSDGSYDNTFTCYSLDNEVATICVQNDKYIVGGTFSGTIKRINSDGSVDNTFNFGGAGFNNYVRNIKAQSDGKLIVSGQFTYYNGVEITHGICRLNQDGTIDNTFNLGLYGFNNDVYFVNVLNNDKILCGGAFTYYNGSEISHGICRLNANGSYDNSFNTGGYGCNGGIVPIAVQSDNKILIGGNFTSYNGVTHAMLFRLNENGTVDNTFNVGGSGFNASVLTIALASDNKIFVMGWFDQYNNNPVQKCLVRLNSDGSLDESFNLGGTGFNTFFDWQYLSVQTDGNLIVGGGFTQLNGIDIPHYLVRLLANNNPPQITSTTVSLSSQATSNTWIDNNSNNADATVPSSGNPQRVNPDAAFNNNPSWLFNGSSNCFQLPYNSNIGRLNYNSPKSLFINFKTGTNINNRQVIFELGGLNSGMNAYIYNNKLWVGIWNNNQRRYFSKSINQSTNYLMSIEFNGSKVRTSLNGFVSSSMLFSGFISNSNSNGIGASINGTRFMDMTSGNGLSYYLGGKIAEILMYNSCDQTLREDVMTYLDSKYNTTYSNDYTRYFGKINAEGSDWTENNWDEEINTVLENDLQINYDGAEINLNYISNTKEIGKIELFDISGIKIQDIYAGELNYGDNNFMINNDNLISGVYFVKAISNSSIISKKVIIIK